MTGSELENALLTGGADLSENKLRLIIERELQKDDGDIDMALINNCFELLSTIESMKGGPPRRVKFPARRRIAAAAAAVLIFSSAAAVYYFTASRGEEKIIEDRTSASVLSQASASSYLEEQLLSYGISPVTLPVEMINGNCTITQIKDVTGESEAGISLRVKFEYMGFAGSMAVENFSEDYTLDTGAAAAGTVSRQNIRINGTDIFIFEYESGCSVIYKAGAAIYNIYLDCGIETATAFAKTIN